MSVMLPEDCLPGGGPTLPGIRVERGVAATGQPKKPSRATVASAERNGLIAVPVVVKVSVPGARRQAWAWRPGCRPARSWPQPVGSAVAVALGEDHDQSVAAAASGSANVGSEAGVKRPVRLTGFAGPA